MTKRIAPDRIYDALIDDQSFAALPGELAAAFGGRSTMIRWHDAGGAQVLGYDGCLTEAQLATYAEHFADQDPWVAASLRHGTYNQATDMEELVPVDHFLRTDFYNDFLRPLNDDTVRCMGMMARNRFGFGIVAVQRGLSQRGYTEAQLAGINALAPHLRRMLAVRGRLAGLERRASTLQHMLDALPQPALLVRPDGRIVETNEKGAAVLAAGFPLAVQHGHLRANGRSNDLLALVAHACCPTAAEAGLIALQPGEVLATITPAKDAQGRQVALLLLNEAPRPDLGLTRLKAMYGLTDAEASVVLLLADGKSVADIADARTVAQATVRKQFRAIAGKMGCSRQAEIAALATRLLSLG